MKYNQLLLASIALLVPACLSAYDFRLRIEDDKTHAAIMDLDPYATLANDKRLGYGIPQVSDSTYLFEGLPDDRAVKIKYVADGETLSSFELTKPTEAMTIQIPWMMTGMLDEVIVEGSSQYITDEKSVFIPSKRDKRIAAGGASLLNVMAIPSLKVDIQSDDVRTVSGDDVSLFIDFVPATTNEIKNLRTMDVERVDVYDSPKDPRFGGARHAVNYILVKYEYGGYITMQAHPSFLADNFGDYSLGSRISYKKMTYSLDGVFAHSRIKHEGFNSISYYNFPELGTIEKKAETVSSLSKFISGFVTFKATYTSDKSTLTNSISFSGTQRPSNYSHIQTSFNPAIYETATDINDVNNSVWGTNWAGNYFLSLPRDFRIVIKPAASYARYNNENHYTAGKNKIVNNTVDDAWSYSLNASIQKPLKQHTLALTLNITDNGNSTKYSGTSSSSIHFNDFKGSGKIEAYLNFDKLNIQGNLNLMYSRQSIGSVNKSEAMPGYFFFANYRFNSRHSARISSYAQMQNVSLGQQSPNLIFSNQIDAVQGNPNLKPWLHTNVQIAYQWLMSNQFSMFAFGGFNRDNHLSVCTYTPKIFENGIPYMIRSYENYGYNSGVDYGISASLRLFDNSLTLQATVNGLTYNFDSYQKYKGTSIGYNCNATYSINNFYVMANYNAPYKRITGAEEVKIPQSYTVIAGWNNGNLNLQVSLDNIFSSSWKYSKNKMESKNFSQYQTTYDFKAHRFISLVVRYSFSFGKRINMSDQGPSISQPGSAILQ